MRTFANKLPVGLGLFLSLAMWAAAQDAPPPPVVPPAPVPAAEAAKPAPAPAPVPAPVEEAAEPAPAPVEDAAKPAVPAPVPAPEAAKPAVPAPVPSPEAAKPAVPAPVPSPEAAKPVPTGEEPPGPAEAGAAPVAPVVPPAPPPAAPKDGFQPPAMPVLTRYQRLWEQSPFTTPPPEVAPVEIAAPTNLGLVGVMDTGKGMMAVLMDKDNNRYVQVMEGQQADVLSNDGSTVLGQIKCLSIQEPNNPYRTLVQLDVGPLKFEEDQLVLKPGPGAPKIAQNPQGRPGVPGQPNVPGQPGQPGQPPVPGAGGVTGRPPTGSPGGVTGASFQGPGRGWQPGQGRSPQPSSSAPTTVTPRRRIILPR